MYNDYADVKKGISKSKAAGIPVCSCHRDTFNSSKMVPGYSASVDGQYNYLITLTQKIIDGGGKGIFYWEPAWITSNLKDPWGSGSSWDNHTLFDFQGSVIKGMNYMTWHYKL